MTPAEAGDDRDHSRRMNRDDARDMLRQHRDTAREYRREQRETFKRETFKRDEGGSSNNQSPSVVSPAPSQVPVDADNGAPTSRIERDQELRGRSNSQQRASRSQDTPPQSNGNAKDANEDSKKPKNNKNTEEDSDGPSDEDVPGGSPSPPRTVAKFFENLSAPAKPTGQPAVAPPVKAVPAGNTVSGKPQKGPQAAKPGAKPLAAKVRGPDFELLKQGMFRPREILASNLTATDQKRAEAHGFKTVSSVKGPGGTGAVNRLVVPQGMSELAALQFLETAAPTAQFGPNHVYRILPAADSLVPAATRDGPVATTPAATDNGSVAPGGAACAAGECYARDLLAWKPSTKQCAKRVRVGLIDTSFDVAHPAFAGRKFSLEQFSGQQTVARGDWHGTAVLSVLAGNASSSTPGLIPDADFFLASTFKADSQGNAAADTMSVLKALAWLDKNKVNIVNMSFSGPRNAQIETVIAAMADKGVVFVAAAGNMGPSAPPSYPAAYPQVVAVTAIGKKLNSYLHANRGDYVDVSAPGVQVLTALPDGRQGYRTGTSFATPFITGLLAAMPAVRNGASDKVEMLSRISFQDLGESGRDNIYGEGLPKAPESCNDIGGVASLPWTNAAKRMAVGAPTAAESALARPASR